MGTDGRMVARQEAYSHAVALLTFMLVPELYESWQFNDLERQWNTWQGRDVVTPEEELRAAGRLDLLPQRLSIPRA